MMKFRVNFYILIVFFTSTLLACQSNTETVSARPKFNPLIDNTPPRPLQYADTTTPYYTKLIERLDSFYNVQVRGGFNGSVLLQENGKIFYERYLGYQNKQKGYKLRYNSSSQLASTSKTFTAAAILFLYQHHYLNIDDKVKDYLPTFPYSGITIKMLMNHRSGLSDYIKWGKPMITDSKKEIGNDKILQLFAKYKPKLLFSPDTRFHYSNSNYCILALVIEAVTEMKYSVFLKKYIFEPLGMNHTFVYESAKGLPPNATLTYYSNWQIFPNDFCDGVVGDKGIYSTVRDMYLWDQSFYQEKLLDNETMELAYGPCSFEKPGIKNYGLGWRMLCYPSGNKIVFHNGKWHGNNTVFFRFIKDNMTFIILGNKRNSNIYRQSKVLYSIIRNVPVSEGFDEE